MYCPRCVCHSAPSSPSLCPSSWLVGGSLSIYPRILLQTRMIHRRTDTDNLHFTFTLVWPLSLGPPPAAALHPCFALLLRCDTTAQFPGEYLHLQLLLADREHARHGVGGGRQCCDHRRRRPRELPAPTPSPAGRRGEAGAGRCPAASLLRCTGWVEYGCFGSDDAAKH